MCNGLSAGRCLPTILYLLSALLYVAFGEETKECSEMTLPSGIPLHCPTEEPENTECCYKKGTPYCCKLDDYDQRLVMVVGLSVISTCFFLTVLIVICCFCPCCLWYNTCRATYTRGEVIAYTKEEEMALHSAMPAEEHNKTSYHPNAMVIKPIADV